MLEIGTKARIFHCRTRTEKFIVWKNIKEKK